MSILFNTRALSIKTCFKSRRATFASWGKFSSHDLLRSNLKRAFQCACSDSLAFSYWFEPCYCYSTCCHTVVLKIILLVFLVLLWNKRSFLGPRGDTTPQRPKAEGRSPAARPSDYKKCCKQLILNIYDHCRLDKAAFFCLLLFPVVQLLSKVWTFSWPLGIALFLCDVRRNMYRTSSEQSNTYISFHIRWFTKFSKSPVPLVLQSVAAWTTVAVNSKASSKVLPIAWIWNVS